MGQGGYTCHQLATAVDQPITVALRSPIPLETDLMVVAQDDHWQLQDPNDDTVIMEATLWESRFATTEAVSIEDAEQARTKFPLRQADHPAPHCLANDAVDESLLWMALDCASGWFVSHSAEPSRQAVTVQFAAAIHEAISIETDYALVSWSGNHSPNWDGRKRGAAAALFDEAGTCVAQSTSFWVAPAAVDDQPAG